MPFVFSSTNLSTQTAQVSSTSKCPNKPFQIGAGYSSRAAKVYASMSSQQLEGTRVVSKPTYQRWSQPDQQPPQNNQKMSSYKNATSQNVVGNGATPNLIQSRAAMFQANAQAKMRGYMQRRQPNFDLKPIAPAVKKAQVKPKSPVRVRSPIASMQIVAEPIQIEEDYMQHYMDATDAFNEFKVRSHGAFFDQRVFVNIMNFQRVQDCILQMQMFDKLKVNESGNQLDYCILLNSETDGIQNRLDDHKVPGTRHNVTLKWHDNEPDKIKRQTEKELGYGPYDAVAYDLPVSSTGGNQRCVRLWKPETVSYLDTNLKKFQETNSLEQQYFVISASLQDVLAKYLEVETTFDNFEKNVVIDFDDSLNPYLAQLEFIRILTDEHHDFTMEQANELTQKCFKANLAAISKNEEEAALLNKFMSTLPKHFDITEQLEKIKAIRSCFEDFEIGEGQEIETQEETKEPEVVPLPVQVIDENDLPAEETLISPQAQAEEEEIIFHKFGELTKMLEDSDVSCVI